MDGAARFSQRDSLATILITAINIIAGFLIGVFQQGIPFQEALKTYTILTVGDGLVAIIPSLLVSVAGGIVVTRASSDHSLGTDSASKCFRPRARCDCRRSLLAAGADSRAAQVFFLAAGGGHGVLLAWREQDEGRKPEQVGGRMQPPKPRSPAPEPIEDGAEARRTDARSRLRPGAAGRCQQGGQLLARVNSLRKTWRSNSDSWSLDSHHRQPAL